MYVLLIWNALQKQAFALHLTSLLCEKNWEDECMGWFLRVMLGLGIDCTLFIACVHEHWQLLFHHYNSQLFNEWIYLIWTLVSVNNNNTDHHSALLVCMNRGLLSCLSVCSCPSFKAEVAGGLAMYMGENISCQYHTHTHTHIHSDLPSRVWRV